MYKTACPKPLQTHLRTILKPWQGLHRPRAESQDLLLCVCKCPCHRRATNHDIFFLGISSSVLFISKINPQSYYKSHQRAITETPQRQQKYGTHSIAILEATADPPQKHQHNQLTTITKLLHNYDRVTSELHQGSHSAIPQYSIKLGDAAWSHLLPLQTHDVTEETI